MGWPLAVSAGLMERNGRAVVSALGPLTVGHVLAMFVVILPFSLLAAVVQWQRTLVPIYLGLCRAADLNRGHEAAGALIHTNLGMAVLVSVVHAFAMFATGGFLAWLVYRYLGLKFLSRSWFNLDTTWAMSLIFVGAFSLTICLASRD